MPPNPAPADDAEVERMRDILARYNKAYADGDSAEWARLRPLAAEALSVTNGLRLVSRIESDAKEIAKLRAYLQHQADQERPFHEMRFER